MNRLVLDFDALSTITPNEFGACTGEQAALLIDAIESRIGPHIWFAFDIHAMSSTYGSLSRLDPSAGPTLLGRGSAASVQCRQIDQFLSGVLAGVRADVDVPTDISISDTESEPDRLVPPVSVEIHLVDTNAIEVYTEDDRIMAALAAICAERGVHPPITRS